MMPSRIAVCLNTFRRPTQLRKTLEAIGTLKFDRKPAPQINVVIVNNDSTSGIEPLLDELRPGYPWPLHGLREPRRGIPQARNRAVRHAQSLGVDYCAFLDDDEYPDPDWLARLMSCSERKHAPIVQGQVIPQFMAEAPAWMVEGRFFHGGRDLPALNSGHTLCSGATNNLLVRSDVFTSMGLFDEWWATQGGDDTEFTLRAARFGFMIVWCPEAIVHEWIPSGRMTVRWILTRGFRAGNTRGLIGARQSNNLSSRLLLLAASLLLVTRSSAQLACGCLAKKSKRLNLLQEFIFSIGTFSGIFGFKFLEYERPYVEV